MNLDITKFSYSDPNVDATFELAADGYMTIEKLALTIQITGANDTKTYDGAPHSAEGYTATNSNALFSADKVSYDGTALATRVEVGTTNMNLDMKGGVMDSLSTTTFSTSISISPVGMLGFLL